MVKTLQNLKDLIELTIRWIDLDVDTKSAHKSMPEGKKKTEK
jgi:hypothetical protein